MRNYTSGFILETLNGKIKKCFIFMFKHTFILKRYMQGTLDLQLDVDAYIPDIFLYLLLSESKKGLENVLIQVWHATTQFPRLKICFKGHLRGLRASKSHTLSNTAAFIASALNKKNICDSP